MRTWFHTITGVASTNTSGVWSKEYDGIQTRKRTNDSVSREILPASVGAVMSPPLTRLRSNLSSTDPSTCVSTRGCAAADTAAIITDAAARMDTLAMHGASRSTIFSDEEKAAVCVLNEALDKLHSSTVHTAAIVPTLTLLDSTRHTKHVPHSATSKPMPVATQSEQCDSQLSIEGIVEATIAKCDHATVETLLHSSLPPCAVRWAVEEALSIATVAVHAAHKRRFATKLCLLDLARPDNQAVSKLKKYVKKVCESVIKENK